MYSLTYYLCRKWYVHLYIDTYGYHQQKTASRQMFRHRC